MISIIIPHHTESIDQMAPLFNSLEMQQGIDFKDIEILIINDNKESAFPEEYLCIYKNIYPRIKMFYNPKEGYMGVSRQIGIDNANGDYVLFIDADDLLYSATILYDLLTRKGADVYSFQFVEELENHNWLIHESQFTWMFAKAYRLQFLREHNIRFSENILWHEDTYFNQVLLAYKPVVENLGYIGYVWKFSPHTITRRNNGEYTSKSMCMYIDTLDERLDRIKYVLTTQQKMEYIVNDIVYMYSTLQNFAQITILDTVREDIEKRLTQYIKKYDPNLTCLDPKYIPQIYERIKGCFQNFVFVPREGFWDFINRIMN